MVCLTCSKEKMFGSKGMPGNVGRAQAPISVKENPFVSLSSVPNENPLSVSELPISHSFSDSHDSHRLEVEDHHAFSGSLAAESVPSHTEVENALRSLIQVFGSALCDPPVRDIQDTKLNRDEVHVTDNHTKLDDEGHVQDNRLGDQVSSDGSETDWAEPSFPNHSRMLQVNGSDRVFYAIHLVQTDAHVQRMVKSLSSDKAVWDAILNNEVVRELRESISSEKEHILRSSNGTVNKSLKAKHVIMRIFDAAKAKLVEASAKIIKIVSKFFRHGSHERDAHAERFDLFNERLRTCFMLSIMVLLIVVVNRVHS